MNTDIVNNGLRDSGADIQLTEQRAGEDRRQVDRRVCDRRELCVVDNSGQAHNRRRGDRRDGERRTTDGTRR